MSDRKSDGQLPINDRSLTVSEHEQKQGNNDQHHARSASNPEGNTTVICRREETPVSSAIQKSNSSNVSATESNRSRSKTVSTNTSDIETIPNNSSQVSSSTSFNFLQSIKDLTHQELYRANPLGLLGKEIISVTGTTHCPEPIPPNESEQTIVNAIVGGVGTSVLPNKLTPIDENEPQQLHFPLNEEEKRHMQRRRSTVASLPDTTLAPYPADYIPNGNDNDLQSHLFSQPSPGTMVADFIPDTMTINVFEVFIYAWGVFAFFFDMFTDLVLAHAYYIEGAYWLFILTLMCVIVPNLTLSIFSLVWYIDGSQLKAAANTSVEETNTSDVILEKDREEINNNNNNEIRQRNNNPGSELVPLHHQRRSSFCQTEDLNGDDQIDAHVSRLKQRLQTPEKENVVKKKHFRFSAATANVLTWIIRIIILVLQLDLCLKYIRGLYYTWKGFQKRHNPKWARFYLTKQILIDADIALLRVFDCFMDSGSQVTLQLYIMLRLGSASMKFDTLFLKQCLSIFSSLGSLAYALSGYSRCWRHMQLTHSPQGWPKGKPPPRLVSWWSTIIQWVWYLFLITPRVLALAMFAATFRSWFWIILVAHWCGMLFWILRFRTIFCISDQTKYNPREAIFEKCYNLVCSYIFIFCYMNLRKGDTRSHYIGFYTIYYIENIAFSIIYAIHSAETNVIFKYSLVTFVCSGFWFAVLFQFLYYRFLHPSEHVRLSTKRNVTSIVHIRTLPRFDRIKKSKSCEEMIGHNDIQNQNENNELEETTSLRLDKSIDERWHNRFAKVNRQKLISQQQAIDQKVKTTRAQKQMEEAMKRQHQPSHSFLTKISTTLKRPTTVSTSIVTEPSDDNNLTVTDQQSAIIHPSYVDSPSSRQRSFFNVPRVSLARPQHQDSYAKMQQEEEDFDKSSVSHKTDKRTSQKSRMYKIQEDIHLSDQNSTSSHTNNAGTEGGEEMILTAATLSSHIMPSSSSSAVNSKAHQHITSTTPTSASLC